MSEESARSWFTVLTDNKFIAPLAQLGGVAEDIKNIQEGKDVPRSVLNVASATWRGAGIASAIASGGLNAIGYLGGGALLISAAVYIAGLLGVDTSMLVSRSQEVAGHTADLVEQIRVQAQNGVPGMKTLYGIVTKAKLKSLQALGLEEVPITSETISDAVNQRGQMRAGKLRPKFISPSPDILDISLNELAGQLTEFTLFNYVTPGDWGNGNASTNPLMAMMKVRDGYRYSDKIDVFDTSLNMNKYRGQPDRGDVVRYVRSIMYAPVGLPEINLTIGSNEEEPKEPSAYSEYESPYPAFSEAYPSREEVINSYLYSIVP